MPSFDERVAKKISEFGVPCFGCTANKLPELIEGVLKKHDDPMHSPADEGNDHRFVPQISCKDSNFIRISPVMEFKRGVPQLGKVAIALAALLTLAPAASSSNQDKPSRKSLAG